MDWKTAWSYLPTNYNTCIGTIENTTQRTCFRNNLSGTKVRVRFSNRYSEQTLVLENVVIGKKNRAQGEIEGLVPVTYQGNQRIIIAPEKEFYSDEIELALDPKEDIILSVYVKEPMEISSVCTTWAAGSWSTRYGIGGNYTYDQGFAEKEATKIFPVLRFDPNKSDTILGITGIQVYTDSQVKTVTLFGDSITHMSYYSDALIKRLYESYPGKITVINRGLGGNRLLHDYSRMSEIPGGGTIFGASGTERFYSDIYGYDQPEYVFVLIGINDFSHPYALKHYDEKVTKEEYCMGITKLIDIAHANGSKIMIGTIIPFKWGEADWFSEVEDLRLQANQWIRSQKLSDGVIDFDLATRQTGNPEYMLDDCHIGDGLHPNHEGGRRMAEAVPLEWFR